MARWTLRLLGVPSLEADGARATPREEAASAGGAPDTRRLLLRRKDAAWLACLALDRPPKRDAIAARVWPPRATHKNQAPNSLNVSLSRLRKQTSARLVEVADVLTFAADLVVEPMDDAALLAHPLFADPRAWERALLSPYEYDDAAEFAGWLASERERLRRRWQDFATRNACAAEDAGELARAIESTRRLLTDDPLSERAMRRLMKLHYRRGEPAAAIHVFEEGEALLRKDGHRPDDETLALLGIIEHRHRDPAARGPAPHMPMPVELLHPPLTIGREAERSRMQQAHRDGLVTVLVGEAGIGKSRLLQDFAAAHAGAVYARAYRHDGVVPYGLLARIVRALAEGLPSPLDATLQTALGAVVNEWAPAQPPRRDAQAADAALRAALRTLMAAARAAARDTLVIDDLHFADAASLEWLQAFIGDEAVAGWRWLLAHRPPAAAEADMALSIALRQSPRTAWIALGPLDAPRVRALLESVRVGAGDGSDALADALLKKVGGNLEHMLIALQAWREHDLADLDGLDGLPPPEQVAELLARRLARLSPDAAALARVAAIAAPDFSLDLAAQVLESRPLALAEPWRELEAAGVLRGEAFAHDLVHDAMVRATPAPIARHIHRETARFLAASARAELASVARHWREAGEHRLAADAFAEAAPRALAAGRVLERASLLQQAGLAYEAAGEFDVAFRSAAQAVGALIHTSGNAAALTLADEWLAKARSSLQRGMVLSMQANAFYAIGRGPQGEAAARLALQLLPDDEEAFCLQAIGALSVQRAEAGDTAEALALLESWERRFEPTASDELRMSYWGWYSTPLRRAGRLDAAIQAVQKQLELSHRLQDWDEHAVARVTLCVFSMHRGDVASALEQTDVVARLVKDQPPNAPLKAWNSLHIGMLLMPLGRLGECLEQLGAACAAFRAAGTELLQVLAENNLALLYVHLGQPAKALGHLHEAYTHLPAHQTAARLVFRAVVKRSMGQAGAFDLLREAAARSCAAAAAQIRLFAELELLREPGDPRTQASAAAALEQEAEATGYLPFAVVAAHRRMNALVALGAYDEAAALAARVWPQSAERQTAIAWRPETLTDCAVAFERAGRLAEADACRQQAWQWLRDVALPNVPDAYRASFLRRPLHQALRAEAQRRGWL